MDVKVDVLKKNYMEKNWEEWPPKYREKRGEFSFFMYIHKNYKKCYVYMCVIWKELDYLINFA